MRLIDADKLKEKLLQMQKDIVESEPRGNAKSDTWRVAYLLILDEYIKMLDEMPIVAPGCDADAILDAYGKGYSKGREDILKEQQLMNNSEMTRDEIWSKVIQNLKILDQEAHEHYEDFVPIITRLLVMTAERLNTDVKHNSVKHEDKTHMWSLVDELGCYSIDGETIKYLPEYQELTVLMREVF